jgi:protein O-GlcNAc transferase
MTGSDNPAARGARLQRALELHRGGPVELAECAYRELLAEWPDDADALNLLGVIAGQKGQLEEALGLVGRALQVNPRHALAHANRARVLLGLGRAAEALESAAQALSVEPRLLEGLLNEAAAHRALGHTTRALESYERAALLQPASSAALLGRAFVLLELCRTDEALAGFEGVLRVDPRNAGAWDGRGLALRTLGFAAEALTSHDRALELAAGSAATHANRAAALHDLGRPGEAVASFERALAISPGHPYGPGDLLFSRLQAGDWRDYEGSRAAVEAGVRAGRAVSTPFAFLSIADSPRAQLRCAQTYFADRYRSATRPNAHTPGAARTGPVSLGYLSADFREHATARLIVGVLEHHDRSAFTVTGLSCGPDDRSALRARVRKGCDRFVDVSRHDDGAAAELIRSLGIDVLVDLNGYTAGGRTAILARRPAPLQVSYLGYPGTLGADCVDYLVADSHVIPAGQRDCYTEQIAYLPGCYQPNDRQRPVVTRVPQRAEEGLPAEAFVFCCFNAPYKITPPAFELWMRLLDRVAGSVLWLYRGNAGVADNLRREAGRLGVASERLIFAEHRSAREHLARYALADLFLDTLPVNAHTTASDALWAGLPVLTCSGEGFAARVAGSLLRAVGLPELVTCSAAEYEQRALELANGSAELARIRSTLARNRLTHPLFDTQAHCRDLERAYLAMWERRRSGAAPETFALAGVRNEIVTIRA